MRVPCPAGIVWVWAVRVDEKKLIHLVVDENHVS